MTLSSTTLGPLTLSEHLILSGLETAPDITVSQRRTLAGYSIVQQGFNIGGRTLTLQGRGHFTLAQIKAVKALAALGQPVTLIHHRGTFVVKIIGTPVEPAVNYSDPDDTVWYSGEITLLEV